MLISSFTLFFLFVILHFEFHLAILQSHIKYFISKVPVKLKSFKIATLCVSLLSLSILPKTPRSSYRHPFEVIFKAFCHFTLLLIKVAFLYETI